MNLLSFKKELKKFATKERAKSNAWFFKTGKGQYGEGDVFLGVTVPNVRKVVKNVLSKKLRQCSALPELLEGSVELLQSKYHEERLAGCILMVELFKKALKSKNEKEQEKIYKTYLKNTDRINNWDLVDTSASNIVGVYLLNRDREILYKLAKSKVLWERRIAIIATLAFIKLNKEYKDTFMLCEILMEDKEDLMHKACGWMLREVGKSCDLETLNVFLEKNATKMPRTMLRYAIERHDYKYRDFILKIK